MIYCDQIISTIKELEYTTVRDRHGTHHINLSCAFDIETTSVEVGEHKAASMYIWQIGIGVDKPVFYGREWADFVDTLETISNVMELGEEKRLIIYVHNLGYEFQFMRKYFNWVDVFAVSERKPIKAICDLGIEFRDSYILSGYSLENTAKNLTKHTIEKLTGDLDYSKKRHHETPLTESEMAYCENDIRVITAYIDEQLDLYKDITKIPMTNTGRVRRYVKHQCYFTSTNHRKSSKGKYSKYRQIMNDLTLTPEMYIQLKRAFMGGFTHANAHHSGKVLNDVSSIDFTSSYPSVMVSEKFPMSRFKPVVVESVEHLKRLSKTYALVFDVKFIGLNCKIEQETYISESKCFRLKNPVLNNGRVFAADEATTTITNIDFDIIDHVYEWDGIEIANCNYAHLNYLPKPIVQSILNLYKDKTTLKDVEGYETEYMLSKGMLNSIYGMSVTDIVKDNSIYDGEWQVEKVDLETEVESYNNSRNRFLYYPWGLWVTAYARRNLWTGIKAIGNDYVYSDTDSLKMMNYEQHQGYITHFNETIISKMERVAKHHNLDFKAFSPKTKTGKVKTMGIWDFEGTYSRFKTLGAKRYLVEDNGRLHSTVAGLSKANGLEYMLEKCGGDHGLVFEMFNDDLYIPGSKTGKMTHTYIDDEQQYIVEDYLGKKAMVNPLSSIHLGPCDFTLSLAEQYKQFLINLSKGYIFKGTKHV